MNVLVRSQELPLFARLGAHPRTLIEDATRDGELFEYWAHEACHIPVEQFPLYRWAMDNNPKWKRLRTWGTENAALVAQVHERVREEGPLVASDLELREGPKEPWWDWDDGKRALEHLFITGKVTATRRSTDFGRLYHAVEDVIPAALLEASYPDEREAKKELLVLAALYHGVGTAPDLADYHRLTHTRGLFDELVEEGRIVRVEVEGWSRPGYMHPDAAVPRSVGARALLSPFDPVVWNRDRAERLFDFHYRLEIYVPKTKRKFGYYVLPFLMGDRIVGRVDLKSDRTDRVLRVQAVWAEVGEDHEEVAVAMLEELRLMAAWLDLDAIEVSKVGNLSSALSCLV